MRTFARTHPVATFFVLAYSITCGSALLARLMVEDVIPPNPLIPAMAGFAPSIAGVILMVWLYGSSGCRYFFSHLNPIRMGLRWPMFCVSAPPLIVSLGVTLCLVSAIGTPDQSPVAHWFTWPNLVTGTLWSTFLGAGVGEELGWRGFALTHLQGKYSALKSSLLIGLAWGVGICQHQSSWVRLRSLRYCRWRPLHIYWR